MEVFEGTSERAQVSTMVSSIVNIESGDLATRAAILAASLGYEAEDVVRFQPNLRTRAKQDYYPGSVAYTPEEHVRGITATILDAPALIGQPAVKANLLRDVVVSASEGREIEPRELRTGKLRYGRAERVVGQVVSAHSQATIGESGNYHPELVRKACDAMEAKHIYRETWHPYRRQAVVAGVAALGLAAAVLGRSRRG